MNTSEIFDKSCMPNILSQAKTLSKKECLAIFNYMEKRKPVNILEFGTQYGCSTRAFLEIANWIGYKINLHSWDISDQVRCVNKKDFKLHIGDLTGREETILKHAPNLVFLDAHPYALTKNIMKICLRDKIDFMCHDVSMDIYERAKQRSSDFTNKSPQTKAEWELYILQELISKDILAKDFFENDILTVNCVRDRFGLAIIEHKK